MVITGRSGVLIDNDRELNGDPLHLIMFTSLNCVNLFQFSRASEEADRSTAWPDVGVHGDLSLTHSD